MMRKLFSAAAPGMQSLQTASGMPAGFTDDSVSLQSGEAESPLPAQISTASSASSFGHALRNGVRSYREAAIDRISPAAGAADVPPTNAFEGVPSLLPNQTPIVIVSVQAKHHASRSPLLVPVFHAAVPSNPESGSEVSIRRTD